MDCPSSNFKEVKTSRLNNRKKSSLNLDLERFEEIKRREKELQADIPPNRIQKYLIKPELRSNDSRSRFPLVSVKDEEREKSINGEVPMDSIGKRTRRSTRAATQLKHARVECSTVKKPGPRRACDKFKEFRRYFNVTKPKYLYSNPVKKALPARTIGSAELKSRGPCPLKLSDKQASASLFEEKVVLSHTYQELIDKVREGMKDSSIDIALLHQLVPKNLEYERNRFSLLQGNSNKIDDFSTFDLDLFLQRLGQDTTVLARRAPLA